MPLNSTEKHGPLVTIVIPTHNRRAFLPIALSSALHQTHSNVQIILVRDGGEPVDDIVERLRDSRVLFINRDENLGKAASLNEALSAAEGKYVAYLDDDDVWYPCHVETLVEALENETDCRLAYTDLYRAYCRIEADGTRTVLSKVWEISRDFDRFLMLCFNHTLHVSLMHHRDLLDRTGPFNEELDVLIDWDLTRKAVFFADFHHVPQITGEFYSPVGASDRLSFLGRRDEESFVKNFLRIRATRPAKPWSCIKDLSIIIVAERFDDTTVPMLEAIHRYTFYPHRVYLPLPASDIAKLGPRANVVPVPVDASLSASQRIDAALAVCEGDLVAVVSQGFAIRNFWIEDSIYPLPAHPETAFELEDSNETQRGIVGTREAIERARREHPGLSLFQSLPQTGVGVRRVEPEEIPFQYDQLLEEARKRMGERDWSGAAGMFEHLADNYGNELWIHSLAADAHYRAGNHDRAGELCREVNGRCPTIDTLLLEARLHKHRNDHQSAIALLERAVDSIDGRESLWM